MHKKVAQRTFHSMSEGCYCYSAYSASSEHRTRQNSNSSTVQPNILFFVFLHFLKFAAWKYRPQYSEYTLYSVLYSTVNCIIHELLFIIVRWRSSVPYQACTFIYYCLVHGGIYGAAQRGEID